MFSVLGGDVRLLQPATLELALPSCRSILAAPACCLGGGNDSGVWLLLSHVVVRHLQVSNGISLPAHARHRYPPLYPLSYMLEAFNAAGHAQHIV